MEELRAYDIDGVCSAGATLKPPYVVISGRTFAEYDGLVRQLAQDAPVYIRGTGLYGDHQAAAAFKSMMIMYLGVTEFHEDHPLQIEIIRANCPNVKIVEYPHA